MSLFSTTICLKPQTEPIITEKNTNAPIQCLVYSKANLVPFSKLTDFATIGANTKLCTAVNFNPFKKPSKNLVFALTFLPTKVNALASPLSGAHLVGI